MKIITRNNRFTNQTEFILQNKKGEDVRAFSLIVGGMAWPGVRPGYVVAVGVEVNVRPPFPLYVLGERECDNMPELIENVRELSRTCKVSRFYGQTDIDANMHFLSKQNREAKEALETVITLSKAPHSDGGKVSYHVNLLLSMLMPNNKTLHFTHVPESRLPSYMQEIQPGEVYKYNAVDNPAVAALGYCVAAVNPGRSTQNRPWREDEKRHKAYNPMDYLAE